MKKSVLIFSFVFILIAANFAAVYATTYTSTISMSGNSTLTGAARVYSAGKHSISMKIASSGGNGTNYCKVTLKKKGVGGGSISTKTINVGSVGSTKSASYGKQRKGKFYYFFNTTNWYKWSSNKVVMKSE